MIEQDLVVHFVMIVISAGLSVLVGQNVSGSHILLICPWLTKPLSLEQVQQFRQRVPLPD